MLWPCPAIPQDPVQPPALVHPAPGFFSEAELVFFSELAGAGAGVVSFEVLLETLAQLNIIILLKVLNCFI